MKNDNISRQAAIDEANAWLLDCLKVQKQNRSCGLIRRLEDLPSAQPDMAKNLYLYKCYITDKDGLQHEVYTYRRYKESDRMGDLISRQAAIDAIGEKPFAGTGDEYDYEQGLQNQWERDVVAIKILPPAQPEQAQWVQMLINRNMYKCSNCNNAWNKRLVFENDGYSKNIFMKYCPCCGRKMQTEVDYE